MIIYFSLLFLSFMNEGKNKHLLKFQPFYKNKNADFYVRILFSRLNVMSDLL
jgi:hypothetical protein